MKRLSIVCAFLMVAFLPCMSLAVDCPIPDTGQTICYDDEGGDHLPRAGRAFLWAGRTV